MPSSFDLVLLLPNSSTVRAVRTGDVLRSSGESGTIFKWARSYEKHEKPAANATLAAEDFKLRAPCVTDKTTRRSDATPISSARSDCLHRIAAPTRLLDRAFVA